MNKFENVNTITAQTGAPIVTDSSVAWFDCKVVETHEIGTHILFIGEVIDYDVIDEEANPMTYAYYHKVRKGLSPKNSPTHIDEDKLREAQKEESGEEASSPNETWTCQMCHYNYDPETGDPITGIPPGTAFEDLPDDWVCPLCGATKDMFEKD
jgi:rubredoxin